MLFFRRKRPSVQNDVSTERLEVFSDGIIAIVITIMVLELKVPHDASLRGLLNQWPLFASYAVSFFYISVYWINHHHLFYFAKTVGSAIIWSNMFFLFCVSLIPISTAFVGESGIALNAAIFYACIMLLCSFAFLILRIVVAQKTTSTSLMHTIKAHSTRKNWLALFVHLISIPIAYIYPPLTIAMTLGVGLGYALTPSWDKNPFEIITSDEHG